MEQVTPVSGNLSRIPRVNFSAPRLRRSVSTASLSGGLFTGNSMPRAQPPPPPRSAKPVLQHRTGAIKRPPTATQENVPEAKRLAMGPPATQKGKLAPWDMKGKLKLAEEKLAKVRVTLQGSHLEKEELENKNQTLEKRVMLLESEIKEKTARLDSEILLHAECQGMAKKLRSKCTEQEDMIATLSGKIQEKEECLRQCKEELTSEIRLHSHCREKANKLQIQYHEHEDVISSLNAKLADREASLKLCQEECSQLQEKVKSLEVLRRAMHNKVMELKGNIRVFCRVRPLLPAESAKNDSTEHISITDESSIDVYKGPKKLKNSFSFDRVFAPSADQEAIFEELAELVQSVIDGYNVCVFAYGQTGSGKTYTMEGGLQQHIRGMIPRSVDLIFAKLEEISKLGSSYSVEASFLEIYNEQLRDLLDASQTDKPCELRNPTSPGGDMVVTNLKVTTVQSALEVNELLERARTNRAVAATVHNDHSSRSHFIFKLRVQISNGDSGKGSDSILSLVDLAGSERLGDITENTRVMETKSINKSLSNLGNVILALSNKNEHVPYRNSKLTHLLQPSLGGNSKTLMLINISPKEECVEETLNSLRFAVRVSECHIGQAKRKFK